MLLMLNNHLEMAKIPYEICLPTAFDADLFFHAMALMNGVAGGRKMHVVHNAVSRALSGIRDQIEDEACYALTKFYPLG